MNHLDCPEDSAMQPDVSHEVLSRLAAQVLVMAQQPLTMSRTEAAIDELEEDIDYDNDDFLLETEGELFADEE
jgi:hypothetical protein